MPARFVNLDHDTPMLLPPDLRDWVPEDQLVHFRMEAVGLLDLSPARVNHRGTGRDQYPPSMRRGLLIYCDARGPFSSRRMERLTYENRAVRFLCADRHPDHDSLCTFRRENRALLESGFHQVLAVAARLRALLPARPPAALLPSATAVGAGTLALDGTKILANASKHSGSPVPRPPLFPSAASAVSHGHAVKQMVLLEEQITELRAKADAADSTPLADGLTVPGEPSGARSPAAGRPKGSAGGRWQIARRRERLEKLRAATAVIEARARERHREELAAFEARQRAREEKQKAAGQKPRGREPKPPQEGPRAREQDHFTDAESRVMKTADGFQQTYNAQAAVEIESRRVISAAVTAAPNDKEPLVPTLGCVSPVGQSLGAVLIDSGFYSAAAVAAAEQSHDGTPAPKIYAATGRPPHGRTGAQLEVRADPPAPGAAASAKESMAHRLATQDGRKL